MAFWNPLIGGKTILVIDYTNPTADNLTLNPSGPGSLKTYVNQYLGDPTGTKTNAYRKIVVNIPNDYYFGSPTSSTAGFYIGPWQPYQDIEINNSGYLIGRGGNGGAGGPTSPPGAGSPGAPGGGSIYVDSSDMKSLTINNLASGTISSGGRGSDGSPRTTQQTQTPDPDGINPPTQQTTYTAGSPGRGGAGAGVSTPGPSTITLTPPNNGPISFRSNPTTAAPLGTSPAANYIDGPGLPKTTINNSGNIYGPGPGAPGFPNFPAGPNTPS